ncbi:MAG: pyridoxal phosphate-dependent aminotransferase family protein [Planctomycetia bacterium]|nr:pyridoxal phosphate-dependent aminotransferase family protein [Planctomycetia bacterium]
MRHAAVLDFTSVLYLGLRHTSQSLRPWAQFATGVPAALARYPGESKVADMLATLQGCESALLAPSTLHLSWDLFGILAKSKIVIYMDAGVYPIVRWGVERAAALGVPLRTFRHYDIDVLNQMLRQDGLCHRRPLIVSDGMCPGCGKPAPVAEYLKCARAYNGQLIIDDTQALGIFGHAPCPKAPYGRGGGGILQLSKVRGDDILTVSSLAKGFGVPVAVLSGSIGMIRLFKEKNKTRVHCSPPSIAVVHAAEHALEVNRTKGDAIRFGLAHLVLYFRKRLKEIGLSATGGLFPVQTLLPVPGLDVVALHEHLYLKGIRTVLHHGRHGHGVRISFLITAQHSLSDIDKAMAMLEYAIFHGADTLKPINQKRSFYTAIV